MTRAALVELLLLLEAAASVELSHDPDCQTMTLDDLDAGVRSRGVSDESSVPRGIVPLDTSSSDYPRDVKREDESC